MRERYRKYHGDMEYDMDQGGNLVYWDCMTKSYQLVSPAQPLTDPHVFIGKVGQQNLLPTHFKIREKDLEHTHIADFHGNPVGDPVPPGVSAFLFWGTKPTQQDSLAKIAQSHLGREVHYKNRLYVTQAEYIYQAGWTPIFAPLIDPDFSIQTPLHVILVPNSLMTTGVFADAQEEEKQAIAEAFVTWTC